MLALTPASPGSETGVSNDNWSGVITNRYIGPLLRNGLAMKA